jgi:hypothetical protein
MDPLPGNDQETTKQRPLVGNNHNCYDRNNRETVGS